MIKSTIDFRGQMIDCRQLQIRLSFVELDKNKRDCLANSFLDAMISCFSKIYYLSWRTGDSYKHIASAEKNRDRLIHDESSFMASGFAYCDKVFDRKSYTFEEKIREFGNIPKSRISKDYHEYYESNIRGKNGEDLKSGILKTFLEKGKYENFYYDEPDIGALFYSAQTRDGRGYYGFANIYVSIVSLNDSLKKTTAFFQQYLSELCSEEDSINASISLGPEYALLKSPHLKYFGRMPKHYERTDDNFRMWRGIEFVCHTGPEWFNIISPRTMQVFHKSKYTYNPNLLDVKKLRNGAEVICCKNEILESDVDDIINIRAYLYSCLVPGEQVCKITDVNDCSPLEILFRPRLKWELCPIFEDELVITETNCIYRYTEESDIRVLSFNNI